MIIPPLLFHFHTFPKFHQFRVVHKIHKYYEPVFIYFAVHLHEIAQYTVVSSVYHNILAKVHVPLDSSSGFNSFINECIVFSKSFSPSKIFLKDELYQIIVPSSSIKTKGMGKLSSVSFDAVFILNVKFSIYRVISLCLL